MLTKKRHAEKAQMKKTIAMHEEKDSKKKADDGAPQNAVPAYLLEREQVGYLCVVLCVCYKIGEKGCVLPCFVCCVRGEECVFGDHAQTNSQMHSRSLKQHTNT